MEKLGSHNRSIELDFVLICFPLLVSLLSVYRLSSISQLVEIVMPGVIMLVIGAMKSYIDVDKFEASIPVADVPVVPYEVLQDMASYPNVMCYDNNLFYRYV